jgi:hydroxyacylglutathione hydrolase
MILNRFYDENLAQASYLVADEKSGKAAVIDPTIDLRQYLEAAESRKLSITHVLETHVHADFLSGAAALATEAGAELCLSAEDDSDWGYDLDSIKGARQLREGDEINLGAVVIRAIHTPGHTPEHLTFLVSDNSRGGDPVGALTGDFIFVGDVGRPDLIEKAVGVKGTMQRSAADLFGSLRRFISSQPDHLQIWPGHGAGSACGKALGSMPSSTLGYEKLFNWALADISEKSFIEEVLRDQPPPPRYFAEMKRRNRLAQPALLAAETSQLSLESAETAAATGGATVIDTRPAKEFAAGHVARTVNIPFNKSFLSWSGALVDPERDVILVATELGEAGQIVNQLAKIGLTRIRGWVDSDALRKSRNAGAKLETVTQVSVRALHDQSSARPTIVDVRAPYEWSDGHIPGAIHIPLSELPARAAELAAAGNPVAVHCKGGGRSSIAASILRAAGVTSVANVSEGFDGWKRAGLPVKKEESQPK